MNSDRMKKMKKKELIDLIFYMSSWICDDSEFWNEEDIIKAFNMKPKV